MLGLFFIAYDKYIPQRDVESAVCYFYVGPSECLCSKTNRVKID